MRGLGLLVVALSLVAPAASAADDASTAEARRYFEAGQKAFVKTKYGAAIAAFEQAQQTAPHPAVVFSLAQAHRLRYFVDRDPGDLQRAAALYRRYLDEAPDGRRRDHAVEHLATVEPMLTTLGLTPGEGTPRAAQATRLMVQVNVEEAQVFLDDQPPVPAPLIEEVAPGRHKIRVEAAGYFPSEATRTAAEGSIAVVDIELTPRPGRVTVAAPEGATLYVDGERRGRAPFGEPIELEPGVHRMELIEGGSKAFARAVHVPRGGVFTLRADLPTTDLRVAADWTFVGSGLLVALGTVALVPAIKLNLDAHQTADKLQKLEKALTADEISTYKSKRSNSDRLFRASAAIYGVAAAGLLAATLIVVLDEPTPGVAPAIDFVPESAEVSVGVQVPLD